MKQRALYWTAARVPAELHRALRILEKQGYPVREGGNEGLRLDFRNAGGDLCRTAISADAALVEYGRVTLALRGVARVLAGQQVSERLPFTDFGVMLDCSRNKVFTPEYLKKFFLQLALFGGSSVMLYCEDTYVLEGEPYWGYMRGGYTLTELQDLDDFAAALGVELIACIQTLGHLEHPLQWNFAYDQITESARVMLTGEEKSYLLIRKMLDFWSRALRSRRIHLGMDEVHDLGRGKNYNLRPGVRPITLFNEHLERVCGLAAEYGFTEPIIWSDMFFRLAGGGDYYDCTGPLPAEIKSRIPGAVRLAYWDYYHSDRKFYELYLDIHRDLGGEPLMFSGIWTWAKFWYDREITERTVVPCMEACRSKGIRELYFTMWGDDGSYCCTSSALLGFCRASGLACGAAEADDAALYAAVTGEDYQQGLTASRMENRVKAVNGTEINSNLGPLLWDDPLLVIHWRGVRALCPDYPRLMSERWGEILSQLPADLPADRPPAVIRALAAYLKAKFEIRLRVERAWQAKDRAELAAAAAEIPAAEELLKNFMHSFREHHFTIARPFGLEIQQVRNAGQLERLKELHRRLTDYLAGKLTDIPELTASCGPAATGYQLGWYRMMASGSALK